MQIRNQIPNLHKNQLFKSGFASISSHPTASAKKVFSEIEPVIRQGNSIKPFITGVYDAASKSGGTLTKGGFLEIRGENIRICGDEEENGLYFVNIQDESNTVKLSAGELGINKSSCIACVVPADLESGTYSIKVVTRFMGGGTLRKEPQEYTFGNFSVE